MLFLAGIVFLVGAVITSQALVAAVVGSVREYATLNALGVGVRALRKVVLEQALWVGALGLAGAAYWAAADRCWRARRMSRWCSMCRSRWPACC